MAKQMYLNLPVENLNASIDFFTKLGFEFNPQFTDENATCMIVSDDIYVMLLAKKFFKSFIKKEIADATKTTEALIGISVESREEVDAMVEAAIDFGGKEPREASDHGWMYNRAFEDLDGHIWEVIYMNEDEMPKEMKEKLVE